MGWLNFTLVLFCLNCEDIILNRNIKDLGHLRTFDPMFSNDSFFKTFYIAMTFDIDVFV